MAEKQEIIDYLVYGVDLKSRRIYFGNGLDKDDDNGPTDFTAASVEVAIRAMHRMVADAPNKPIEIHMSSEGGDPYAMLRLHDEILACPAQVKFYGGGAIMSAATWIMVVCDERYLHPNATVMAHDGSEDHGGKHTDVQISAAEMKRVQDTLYDIYTANTRMPKAFWEDVCQRDLYLSASEAVSLGMADKILEPKKRGNLRKSRQAALKKHVDAAEMQKIIESIYGRINKVKVPNIQLNPIVKEAADPAVFVDNSKIETTPKAEPTESSIKSETNF